MRWLQQTWSQVEIPGLVLGSFWVNWCLGAVGLLVNNDLLEEGVLSLPSQGRDPLSG